MTIYPSSPGGAAAGFSNSGRRNILEQTKPYAFLVETEAVADGEAAQVTTVFLTNRECPWRCLMCDLWRNTLDHSVPEGAITEQICYALQNLPSTPREACAFEAL